MYDRTFTLIGNFTDNVTPALDKINLSLDGVKKNLASLSRSTAPLRADFRDLANASKDFNDSLKGQTGSINQGVSALREYRREIAKLNRVQSKLNIPSSGGYGGGGRGSGRRSGYSGGYGGGGGGIARDGSFIFSQVLGNQIAGLMTNAITQGFQIGVGLMVKPFEYFQRALKERIADEQSDIKAAGGYFSISQRQIGDKKFIKSFQEAMEYTQENNKMMATLAAALPGNTQQYIEVSKRLSDSIARTVLSDPKKAIEYANQLRADPERIGGPIAKITDMGSKGIRQAITELQSSITKKTVLAGLGGGAQGGVTGAYGLPGLSERLLTQGSVSMGQFQRYAAIFRDPMISDALSRYIPKINATQAASIERVKVLEKMFDDILPPEVIRAYMRSTAGIIEAFNTAIFGPETGLFGLGRKMKGLGKKMDDRGRVIEGELEIGLSDMIRDIFANVTTALQPLAEILPSIFDPVKAVAETLVDIRHATGSFLYSFERYKEGLTQYAKGIENEAERLKFSEGGMIAARASLSAINNLFRKFGVYGKGSQAMDRFLVNAEKIMSANLDPATMLKEFADTFMDSHLAYDMGKAVGTVIKTALQQISGLLDQIMGVTKTSKLITGLQEGIGKEGKAAFVNIIRKVFEGLGMVLLEVFKTFPFEIILLGAFTLLMPALTAGLSNALGVRLERFIDRGLPSMVGDSDGGMRGRRGRFGREGSIDRLNRRRRRTGAMRMQLLGELFGVGYEAAGKPGHRALGTIGKVGKYIPGGALVGGAIDMGTSLATGESFGKAAAGAIGTVLGGTVGTVFGPVGTMIGGVAGSYLGNLIYDAFDPAAIKQREAALQQTEAAARQLEAAKIRSRVPTARVPLAVDSQTVAGALKLIRAPGALEGTGVSAQITESVRLRNLALQAVEAAEKRLADIKAGLDPKITPGTAQYDRLVKPYQDSVDRAAVALRTRQANMEKALEGIPQSMNDALVLKISTMSPKAISDAVADVVRNAGINEIRRIGWEKQWYKEHPGQKGPPPPLPPPGAQLDRLRTLPNPGGNPSPRYSGGLGDAISKELKMKPSGSDLVIANSSETIIPAAGGNGMGAFLGILRSGFSATVVALVKLNQTLTTNQQKNDVNFKSLGEKFSSPSMPGGLGGAKAGGVDAFTPLAQRFGLTMTSGYRPGDSGWHGANRARDFSNGSGPTPQMLQFAHYLASYYGSNLKELIYTPLGFSILNGRKVAPYSQSGHYNHVHVAYAYGPNSPAFFSRQRDAIAWEKAMMPGGAKVASFTSNSSEGFGTTIQAPITIYQQPGQDSEELARIIIARFGMAVQTISNHM